MNVSGIRGRDDDWCIKRGESSLGWGIRLSFYFILLYIKSLVEGARFKFTFQDRILPSGTRRIVVL